MRVPELPVSLPVCTLYVFLEDVKQLGRFYSELNRQKQRA